MQIIEYNIPSKRMYEATFYLYDYFSHQETNYCFIHVNTLIKSNVINIFFLDSQTKVRK